MTVHEATASSDGTDAPRPYLTLVPADGGGRPAAVRSQDDGRAVQAADRHASKVRGAGAETPRGFTRSPFVQSSCTGRG